MAVQLCLDDDVDQLVEILDEDAGIEDGTEASSVVHDLAYNISRLRIEVGSSSFIETTEDDVIITIKIPRT